METPSYTLEFEKPLRDLARQLDELRQQSIETNADLIPEIRTIEKKIERMQREIYSNLTPWQKVLLARHPKRPYALDYVSMICRGFQELHGDRQFNDDRALVGGTAFFDGEAVMIVAQQKGRDTKEKISAKLRDAAARGLPKGPPDHEDGREIPPSRCLVHRHPGRVPRRRLGGAPRLGGDRRQSARDGHAPDPHDLGRCRRGRLGRGPWHRSHRPGPHVREQLLLRDHAGGMRGHPLEGQLGGFPEKAAAALKVDADDLEKLGAIDEVIPEPLGGAHNDPAQAAAALKYSLHKHLNDLRALDMERLLETRYERYRHIGTYEESGDHPLLSGPG